MAIAKITFNNEDYIDLTKDTLDANTMHEDFIAFGADGVSVTGEEPYPSLEKNIIEKTLTSYSDEEMTAVVTNMFIWQTIMTSVYLPNVTSIGGYGFYHCESLPSVNFPKVTSIGEYAFHSCPLVNVNFPLATSIGQYSFCDCTSLSSVNLPLVTTISTHAFESCSNLETATFGNVTSVGDAAFRYCTKFKTSFPYLTTLNNASNGYTFQGTGYTEVTDENFPNLTSMSCSALFMGCTEITKVHLTKVTTLGRGQYGAEFDGCSNIKTIVLPSVTYISDQDFRSNSKLEAIDMYGTVGNRGNNYTNDSKLKTIVVRKLTGVATLSDLNNFTGTPFASNGSGGTIYVPQALISAYENATNWSTIIGYTNNQILPIEGSEYEHYYVDGVHVKYVVGNFLTNVTTSNSALLLTYLEPYTTTLNIDIGYEMSTIVIKMGNIDITQSVYDPSTGIVSIPSVTGNVTIEAVATPIQYDWDYEWDYTDGSLADNGWKLSQVGTGSTATMTENGFELISPASSEISYLKYENENPYLLEHGVMEVTLSETFDTSTAYFNATVAISNGTYGIIFISPKGVATVRNVSAAGSCLSTGASVPSGQPFTLRLGLNGNSGNMSLDGRVIWRTNDANGTSYNNSYRRFIRVASVVQKAGYSTIIKSIKLKNLEEES